MFLTSLLMLSCQSEQAPTETQADILNRMEVIGQRSIQQLLQVDPTLIHEAWTDSMVRYSDDTCPPMEEYNGMDLWRESCTTENGNQFLGWALNLRIDHHIEQGYGWEIHDWLSGQARIISDDVELSNYGDVLHEVGTNPFGRRALHGLIFGNFAWNDETAGKTWLADNLNIEYEYRFEETENGKWISHIDAWLSNYDDSIHGEAVIWENISFHQGDCDQEPVDGLLWIREGEGRWVRLDFDDTCDGCGTIVGTEKQLCFDFSMWFDWEEFPWDPRPSIQWGTE